MKYLFKILIVLLLIVLLYLLWKISRPVEIVAIHYENASSDILVKNFPLTINRQIAWWQENKTMLKEKYGLPQLDTNGLRWISFWNFGEGYQIEKPEDTFFPSKDTSYLLCFDDMKVAERCIVKDRQMHISITRDGVVLIYFGRKVFIERPNGEIVRGKDL
ncbi:DUF943 family protein [Erwiniaceae bacterium BAC15a-03b]|uniref:DUF943 family protein n=1 Tax=Winslowiella arboricola TaxID=2978220 RepID=A0A9J6PRV4_9GAMM|nr:DUF943 family protein [Winslowiella arboricola]MCU5773712.1 DUF943 family protein [Winslowiella arboricola]MCU5778389.1 DUF943 family protein [Winslowiella arboricola]